MPAMLRRHLPPALLGLLLWGLFTWPLPRHFAAAIPYSDRRTDGGDAVRLLVPGDHLQLLYHFWLARDTLAGRSPLFHNVYEFNLGDDRARFSPDPYYLPFSLVYAAAAPWAGDAAGWNLAGLLSILLGISGCFALARRYTAGARDALVVALLANAFPYRWITLLNGSPTGFAMGLAPWLFVGLDAAVRDRRAAGGWLAGLSLLGAYTADLHVFYFGALATPAWCLLAWLAAPGTARPAWPRLAATLRALLPAVALAAVAAGLSVLASRHLSATDLAGGRSWAVVKMFSPRIRGLYTWRGMGMTNHVFFGSSLALLLASGLAWRWRTARAAARGTPGATATAAGAPLARTGLLIILLCLAVGVAVALALGTNGPLYGLPLRVARKLVPKFTMIRQTVKVYCLLPTLLTALGALLLPAAAAPRGRRARLAAAGLALLVLAEFRLQLAPGLCALPPHMPAYEAVATVATSRGDARPQALVVPLWPGESHWTSVYQYGVTRSRLRLVNGYAPAFPEGYVEQVFRRFESANQGVLDAEQFSALRGLGVRYLLFHEQPYPEQVSPFPSGVALRRLLQNGHLDLLAHDGVTWSFVLRDVPRETQPDAAWGEPLYAAARQWPFAGPARAAATNAWPLRLRGPAASAPSLHYLLRVEGSGVLASDDGVTTLQVDAPRPTWLAAACTGPLGHTWRAAGGGPRIRHALLTAGTWPPAGDGSDPLLLRAADLFHQGATEPRDGSVLLDPARDSQGRALWGPNLPLPAGRYRVTLRVDLPPGHAAADLNAGVLIPALTDGSRLGAVAAWAGRDAECTFDYDASLPLCLEFHYHRTLPLRVAGFELQRLDAATP